jgi:diguanylate cyclase (GGDEF)-like protein
MITKIQEVNMVHDFASATREVIHFLHQKFGFHLWMVTRTDGNDWIVLAVEDDHYGIKEGSVFRWSDSFCSRMTQGLGPRIAPRADLIPAYVDAPIGKEVEIGAYVGMPIVRNDGSLFGTLCAIDPSPQAEQIRDEQALIELLTGLLSSLLNAELDSADATRRAERAEMEATRDVLTSLYNRRGWNQLLEREEDRCRRYGNPACVISIDIDELKTINDTSGHAAGDALLVNTAHVMREVVRLNDIVARVGGDEFCILGVECDSAAAEILVRRLRDSFRIAGIKASIGYAIRIPKQGLQAAYEEADAEMYREKKGNR